jgi:hypothetical protein
MMGIMPFDDSKKKGRIPVGNLPFLSKIEILSACPKTPGTRVYTCNCTPH